MIQGVCRVANRGLPQCVVQLEKATEKEQERVRGSTKAAVLHDDPECPDLVAVSVYDTKPVHFMSMMCEDIKWITKSRKIFDCKRRVMVNMNFCASTSIIATTSG